MSSSLDRQSSLQLALCNVVSPQNSTPMEKDEGLRPLGESLCVYKCIFKHVKRLFAAATKVMEWMKMVKKKCYSLDSLGVSFEVLEEVVLDWDL